jgi:F0F1-type ATP synthase membrane subunit b/b'
MMDRQRASFEEALQRQQVQVQQPLDQASRTTEQLQQQVGEQQATISSLQQQVEQLTARASQQGEVMGQQQHCIERQQATIEHMMADQIEVLGDSAARHEAGLAAVVEANRQQLAMIGELRGQLAAVAAPPQPQPLPPPAAAAAQPEIPRMKVC